MSADDTSRTLHRGALALAAGVLSMLLGGFGLAAPLDDILQRWLSPARASAPAPPCAVLVIGSADPWPWRNGRLADLLDRLRDAGVRGVALDLPLETRPTDPEGDARLARALLDNRVALGVALEPMAGAAPHARMPPVEFADAARLGHLQLPPDRDGRIRQHLSYVLAADGVRWPSLPQALAQPGHAAGAGARAVERWRIGATAGVPAPPTLPAAAVLDGRVGASQLHGRWVLVGLADPAWQPRLRGPFGSEPLYPVEHEARALAALLQGATLRPLPTAVQAVLAMLLAGVPVLLGLSGGGRGWRLPVALLGGLAAALALCAWLLGRQVWFAPGGTAAVLAGGLLAWGAIAARRQLGQRQDASGLAPRQRLETALHAARTAGRPHALLVFRIAAAEPDAGQADACRLAGLLRERARRPGDVAARLDDGCFALLLPGTPASAAGHILEEIQQVAECDLASAVDGSVHGCDGEHCDCAARLAAVAAPGTAPPA